MKETVSFRMPEKPFLRNRIRAVKVVANEMNDLVGPLVGITGGIAVIIGAFKLIDGAYEGEAGLGAYLRDGEGYKKSEYKEDVATKRPPPPKWLDKLSLPSFEFVQVYTSGTEAAVEQAELLRIDLAAALERGDIETAQDLESKLARLMRDNGLRYESDEEDNDSFN
eukprot:CAMPEP_0197321646 /NCGR_PEP_ID=MMETSP0891-20130614/65689_1 /TAXON_ID=44058 ORGANISM="Aureoumbra lagunensis, Strain CCMP1510" /NCGR_SAMPLE_ID=MMETSP0891 /ASSEMBLY_ACC=CAM_ASM_000534 /LENGTH=166 /DNA_ID=CAMNT_0042813619 /DNA_START=180 /DNA_END=680 /DNA_ORIENTATION=-